MTRITALWALLLSVALLVFGTNLQGVLLPILGHERGSGMTAIGLFSSAWSTGFVIACLLIGRILSRLGHARTLLLLSLVSAAASALLPHHGDPVWIVLRLVIGFCFGGLSTIVESWLIEQAGGGVAFAGYMMVTLMASLGGTLSLNAIDPLGSAPFILMTGSVALSSLPVLLTRVARPAPVPASKFELAALCRRSPLGAIGIVATGLITGAIGGLGPIFGMEAGLTMRDDTLMLAANSVGGALAYAPLGVLAERIDRRLLLAADCALGLMISLPLAFSPHALSYGMVVILFGAFGFAQYPIYGICVGIVNREAGHVAPTQIASELLLLFGLGTILGPLAGAELMRFGVGLFVPVAIILLALLTGTVARTSPAGIATAVREIKRPTSDG